MTTQKSSLSPLTKEILKYVLEYLTIILVVFMIGFMFLNNKDGQYTNTINLCVGAVLGSLTTVYAYEFGSSKGSAEKNEMLYNSKPTLPVADTDTKNK